MKSTTSKTLIVAALAWLTVGCAETIKEREGATLQMVPVTHTYHLTIKKNKHQQAWQQLNQYVEQNWQAIANQPVQVTWMSTSGKRMADKLTQELKKRGISSEMVRVEKGEQQQHFDLSVATTSYKVVTEVCDYMQIGQFGAYREGCYPENLRWQSMVHPEKMLLSGNEK
ncbi:hypothetical protein JCM19238_1468 [Vibrio ponticus]|nr:hypothetical protein JCM19238_1468 [Vibrio ponticus]